MNTNKMEFNTLVNYIKFIGFSVFIYMTNSYASYGIFRYLSELIIQHQWIYASMYIITWSLAGLSLYLICFMNNLWYRLIYGLMIVFSTVIAGGYTAITAGANLTMDMMVRALRDLGETNQTGQFASEFIKLYVNSAVINYLQLCLFGVLIILLPVNLKRGKVRILKLIKLVTWKAWLFPIIIASFICMQVMTTVAGFIPGYPVQYVIWSNLLYKGITASISQWNGHLRQSVTLSAIHAKQANIVFIGDESVRGDFIDFNHDLGTTPYLNRHKNNFINFGFASSGGNRSDFSQYILRTGGQYNNLSKTVITNPYIWQFAKHAGYKTVLIGLQHAGRIGTDFNSSEELQYIDDNVNLLHIDLDKRDIYAADYIRKLIKNTKQPLFICVMKVGAHWFYDYRYPPEQAFYRPHLHVPDAFTVDKTFDISTRMFKKGWHKTAIPVSIDTASGALIEKDPLRLRMLNSYRNVIRWSVDHFFAVLLQEDLPGTSIVYTSDHGQNLLDNIGFPHSNVIDPFYMEGIVPLFIYSKDPLWQEKFKRASKINQDKSSHFEIFSTLLLLMGYDHKQVFKTIGPSLLDPISHPRKFTSGEIWESWGNREILWHKVPDIKGLTIH